MLCNGKSNKELRVRLSEGARHLVDVLLCADRNGVKMCSNSKKKFVMRCMTRIEIKEMRDRVSLCSGK